MELVYSAIALILGAVGTFFLMRARIQAAEDRATNKEIELAAVQSDSAKVREELSAANVRAEQAAKFEEQLTNTNALLSESEKYRAAQSQREEGLREQIELLMKAREELKTQFAAVSQEALQKNNEQFLTLASENLKRREQAVGELVKPIQEGLEKLSKQTLDVEKERVSAYSGLTEQVKGLMDSQVRLQLETGNLVKALRAPHQRGRWGEIQLRRVVEMAGMVAYCDFTEQEQSGTESGQIRPDLIINMPSDRRVIVDAKTVLDAYLSAIETTDETERTLQLARHARQIRDQIKLLKSKEYWNSVGGSVDFVVLFLPGEPFFSAALEQDPELIQYGVENRVLIATPTTLIALLRAIEYGWRQETLAKNAQEISELGKELYSRISTMADHFKKVGKGLDGAVKAYNDTVSSLESRVLPSGRRFRDLKAANGAEIDVLEGVDRTTRTISAPEFAVLPELEQG
jgi:DNA recombination protein RmuC